MMSELLDVLTVHPTGDGAGFTARSVDWFGPRLFGGTIVAQALNAAMQTVPTELRPHSLHGYFLRAVEAGPDSDLRVEHVRDGRTFTTRRVTTSQGDKAAFVATCSFCADEDGVEYQGAPPDVPAPEDCAPAPMEAGPIDQRDLGPTPPRRDGTMASTRRAWFGVEPMADDPIQHATMLAYMSDMTGTSFRPLSLDEWGSYTDASLDHAVWFHRLTRADGWHLYDLHALINAGGRSTVRGAMYTREGQLCLSLAQELLIRPTGLPPTPWPPSP